MLQPRVSVFLAVSLDGYIAREDGSLDWLSLVQTDPAEDTGYEAFMASIDALLVGRHTYETALTFDPWPYRGKRVVVLTSRTATSRHGETFSHDSLPSLVKRLGEEGVNRIYLDGGTTIRQGLQAGIVTDMTLSWVPLLLGSGIPLFEKGLPETHWHLQSSRSFPSGLLQATYVARTAQS
jgi:dihydrofolate reductase